MSNIDINTFIDKRFITFSKQDNVRSIPSLIDGLKDSQRRVVYAMSKHGNGKIKVSQLAEYSSMVTDYNHGAASLEKVAVGLSRDFAWSNNLNVFGYSGQHGTILDKDAAASRYIYAMKADYFDLIFAKEDADILEYRVDPETNESYEPLHFYPIVPLCLVNYSAGIGTGYATNILPRKASNVIDAILLKLKKQSTSVDHLLFPYVKNWNGKVEKVEDNRWLLTGNVERLDKTRICITDIPPHFDQASYKAVLVDLLDEGHIKEYENYSTVDGFKFIVELSRDKAKASDAELIKMFKLASKEADNVTLWDTKGTLTRFDSVEKALEEFVEYRLSLYPVRKQSILKNLNKDLEHNVIKRAFIEYWLNNQDKKLSNKEVEAYCNDQGWQEYTKSLIDMPIRTLTVEKIKELDDKINSIFAEIEKIEKTDPKDMYVSDLQRLKKIIEKENK